MAYTKLQIEKFHIHEFKMISLLSGKGEFKPADVVNVQTEVVQLPSRTPHFLLKATLYHIQYL